MCAHNIDRERVKTTIFDVQSGVGYFILFFVSRVLSVFHNTLTHFNISFVFFFRFVFVTLILLLLFLLYCWYTLAVCILIFSFSFSSLETYFTSHTIPLTNRKNVLYSQAPEFHQKFITEWERERVTHYNINCYQ